MADVSEGEIEQFGQGVVAGEYRAIFDDFAQAAVDRFDGVGGVNHLPNRQRVVKDRAGGFCFLNRLIWLDSFESRQTRHLVGFNLFCPISL